MSVAFSVTSSAGSGWMCCNENYVVLTPYMVPVESQSEPLIENVGKGPSQPWEHR